MAKRKVQAQRKFAQGAYIPPSSSNNLPERRLDGSGKEEPKIIYNSMSAKSLLDIVSLKTMHTHLQPYVLLERIEASNEEVLQPQMSSKLKCLQSNNVPYDKRLRSRLVRCSKSIKKRKYRKRHTIAKQNEHNSRPNNVPTIENFSLEDNKPLTYFASNQSQPTPAEGKVGKRINDTAKAEPAKRKRRPSAKWSISKYNVLTRSRSQSVPRQAPTSPSTIIYIPGTSKTAVHSSKVSKVKPIRQVQQQNLPLDQCDSEIVTAGEISFFNKTESAALPSSPLTTYSAQGSIHDLVESESTTGVSIQDLQRVETKIPYSLNPEEILEESTKEIDGLVDDLFLKPEEINVDDCLNEYGNPGIEDMVPEEEVSLDITAQYYGNAAIDTWISDTTSEASTIKIGLRPMEDKHQSYQSPIIDDSSNCPLKRLRTLKDFCSAINQTIDFCVDCLNCKVLNSLLTVIKKVLSPSHRLNDDVYDFDSLRDGIAEDPQMSFGERRRQRLSRSQEHAATENGNSVYLNILAPDSTNFIKITPFNNISQDDFTLRVNLIEKSQAKNVISYNLDASLDDVIQSLVSNPATEMKEDTPSEDLILIYTSESTSESDAIGEVLSGMPDNQSKKSKKRGFPKSLDNAMLVDAPIYYPTQKEFLDPIAYFEKIMPAAARFGLCKVVPPEEFGPSCYLNESFKFSVSNQYVARLYNRWSPLTKEMCAIKAYSASQNVPFNKAPLVEGLEVNLPKLYHLVQRLGGLQNVIRKKRWNRVAEEMRFTKGRNPGHKLDVIYVKYLLPYDTLSHQERQKIMCQVEKSWQKKNLKMLERASNPLQRQKRLLGESDETESSDDDTEDEYASVADAEDCVVAGRPMNLKNFKKVASNAMDTYFPRSEHPTAAQVEEEYWRVVLLNTDHVCVNSASIDTGVEGYGFSKNADDPYSKHPWNLKVISDNSGNVMRSLGPVLGVTVPTLHLGMVFSTSCWHRDPHGLPWIEYMHNGPGKIWYGIPDEQSNNFRKAVEKLCPTSCQNKSIWLPSDITMIPPSLLLESDVSLSRVEQRPGEFIIVFPKAYSSSLSMGLTQSESVYFATKTWLNTIHQVFQEARDSCEPTMFAVEQLLIAVARDPRAPLSVLQQVHSNLKPILDQELQFRRSVEFYGIKAKQLTEAQRSHNTKKSMGAFNVRDLDECQICRTTLYMSKVTGVTGKRSTTCLQHTLCILEKMETVNPNNLELIVYYSSQELKLIIYKLQNRISPSMSAQPGPSWAS